MMKERNRTSWTSLVQYQDFQVPNGRLFYFSDSELSMGHHANLAPILRHDDVTNRKHVQHAAAEHDAPFLYGRGRCAPALRAPPDCACVAARGHHWDWCRFSPPGGGEFGAAELEHRCAAAQGTRAHGGGDGDARHGAAQRLRGQVGTTRVRPSGPCAPRADSETRQCCASCLGCVDFCSQVGGCSATDVPRVRCCVCGLVYGRCIGPNT